MSIEGLCDLGYNIVVEDLEIENKVLIFNVIEKGLNF